ncbi:glycosyltransferase [Planococcus sp. CAU13]|uniref:glycosyltransferase n=1 Tax=Planococcus sp. CAU13 TaxID=1541197 RepID=UPI00052FFD9D|nr:glycosyltransferase [Planococcus sp. CAU13]
MNKLVSFIVPVYNAEKYLEQCIDSILNQSHERIEVILVNDGSADRSGEICNAYKKKDGRIKVLHQDNAGPSVARNRGIEAATGEYIQFVDSDDYIAPHMTETLLETLKGGLQLVICGYQLVTREGQRVISMENFSFHRPGIYSKEEFLAHFGEIYQDYYVHYNWNKLYITDLIRQNGLRFDEEIIRGEDLFFNLQYLEHCRKIAIISDFLYYYTTSNNESITSTFRPDLFENQQLLLETTRGFLRRNGAYSGTNKDLIEKFYTVRIAACFSNLFHPDSTLSREETLEHIREIMGDQRVNQSVAYFEKGDSEKRRIGKWIRKKAVKQLYVYYYVKSEYKKRFGPKSEKWI